MTFEHRLPTAPRRRVSRRFVRGGAALVLGWCLALVRRVDHAFTRGGVRRGVEPRRFAWSFPTRAGTFTRGGALGVMATAFLGCAPAQQQRLEYGLYASPAMQRDMTYSVYTPPGWSASEQLPLVVLLHGAADDPRTPDKSQVGQVLDAHMTKGDVPRVVIAVPQGDLGFWENWYSGERRYRDWVTQELVPHVQRRYHTQPCPEGCHVMGVSMGGAGALSFALAEPHAWRSVSVISAPIFDIDDVRELYGSFWVNVFVPVDDIWGPFDCANAPKRDVYTRWQSNADMGPFSLLVTWGSRDSEQIRETSLHFQTHLKERGMTARTFEFDGDHSWASWRDVFPVVLREQVGLAVTSTTATDASVTDAIAKQGNSTTAVGGSR